MRALHQAFSDIEYTIDDQIAAGDKVVERWTVSGTHTGDWLGIPATGRRITFGGMDISRLQDGRMAEHWTQVDVLSLLQQMGVIPEQAGAPA